jgi:hypothetical protein
MTMSSQSTVASVDPSSATRVEVDEGIVAAARDVGSIISRSTSRRRSATAGWRRRWSMRFEPRDSSVCSRLGLSAVSRWIR